MSDAEKIKGIAETIEGLGYLLEFQKEALIDDLPDPRDVIESILDAVFWSLFKKGVADLTSEEQRLIDVEVASFIKSESED